MLKLQCAAGVLLIICALAAVVFANNGSECHAAVEWEWTDSPANTVPGAPSAPSCGGPCNGGAALCAEGTPAGMGLMTTCACGGNGGTGTTCNVGWMWDPDHPDGPQITTMCFFDDCPPATPICTHDAYTISGPPGNDIGGVACECYID